MKNNLFLLKNLTVLFVLSLFVSCNETSILNNTFPLSESPGPSDEDDPLRDSLKQDYLDNLYYAAEGTDINAIRAANLRRNLARKKAKREQATLRSGVEMFANNKISGEWYQRGPNNEAGDIREVSYLPSNDDIYAISSVGHLWKGNLAGTAWTLLDDSNEYDTNILQALPHNGGTRLFACYGSGSDDKKVRYSDDDGSTWTQGTGFSFYDHWGSARRFIPLSDNNTIYYLVHTWSGSPWGQVVQLYVSTDKGETYSNIWQSNTDYKLKEVDLWKPHDSDELFLVDNEAQNYYEITHNFGTATGTISAPISFSGEGIATGDFHLTGRYNSTLSDYELFINTDANQNVYKTSNGSNWTYLSTSSDNIWRKGWLADPNNSNLYAGGFQLNLSTNETTWNELYAQWWEYYGNSKDYLHVDMMNFDYYEKADGTPFILICNHAGIHVTYDSFGSTTNLGLLGLNVTTLYDQTTSSDGFLYCGAQDKGTFTTGSSTSNFSQLSTDNRSTGDGMLGCFFNADQSYYGMIQNGQFGVFPNRAASNKTWYTIPGNHKSGWINPMVSSPDFNDNKAYMAGGNLNGGDGCYLIEMDVQLSGNSVTFNPTQFNYDFRANSNSSSSVIKAIGVSALDEDRIYVATADATFFKTTDQGTTWTKSSTTFPTTLLPWEIISSNTNVDRIFISGTGNSNTGVYESTDGGDTFFPLSNGIPSATIYEVALSDDDALLFAATSDGPYVYIFDDAQWYSLMGAGTPIVDYNSVDNIGNQIIRFGTYGRGVWDLEITATALPVLLAEFEVEILNERQSLLNWTTEQERSTENFEIEHSTNAVSFRQIGTVTAVGNSDEIEKYQFIHKDPKAGDNYYRLKIKDVDGSFEYSEIETITIKEESTAFNLYPNPILENGILNINTSYSQTYSIEIVDVAGRLLFSKKDLLGETSLEPELVSGVYFYRIMGESGILVSEALMVR